MNTIRKVAFATLVLALGACATTHQVSHSEFRPPEGAYRLIVMQPDISVALLTAGGGLEPREDWTNQAREYVLKALVEEQRRRGGEAKIAATREDTGADPELVSDLIWLHKAVGQSIKQHKYTYALTLPTKKDRFDWTLGSRAVEFGSATQYDYALFLHAQDSFSSGGRVALQVAAALACGFGACVVPTGGMQAAFASLVDLKTGQVVWFNTLASSVGDIRTEDGARKMVTELLGEMRPGDAQRATNRT